MPPQQPYAPRSRPIPSQPTVTPHAPHMGYGSLPLAQERFQQHATTGQYQVVTPPAPTPNDGQSGHNPYQFIFENDTNHPKRRGLMGDAFFKLIAIAVGGVIILLVVAGIVINALTPKGSVPGMTQIAERQQEIVRIATEATQQTTDSGASDFVINTALSVSSSQTQITGYLAEHNAKLGAKTLALDKSTRTDTELAAAATANNYDNAVTQNLVSQLQTYEQLLQSTYKQTDSKTAQQLLQTTFNSADLLVRQGQAVEQSLSSN